MLAKLNWKLRKQKGELRLDVLQHKYGAVQQGTKLKPKTGVSHIWRGLRIANKIINSGAGWVIGNREKVRFWLDTWLGSTPLIEHVTQEIDSMESRKMMKDYWRNTNELNWDILSDLLPQDVLLRMRAMRVVVDLGNPDKLCWKVEENEKFQTKSA